MMQPIPSSGSDAGAPMQLLQWQQAAARNAIGWNILPSMPLSTNIGRYTTMMMSWPKINGLLASPAAANTSSRRSSLARRRSSFICACARCRMQFSTIITTPSMMMSKSSAPRRPIVAVKSCGAVAYKPPAAQTATAAALSACRPPWVRRYGSWLRSRYRCQSGSAADQP